MARICPQCSLENNDQSVFCSRCGFRFSQTGDATPLNSYSTTPALDEISKVAYSDYSARTDPHPPGVAAQSYGPPQSPPVVGATPFPSPQPANPSYGQQGTPGYGSITHDPYGAPGGSYQQQQVFFPGTQPPQGQQYPGQQPPQGQPYYQTGTQRNAGQGLSMVQRAFAGRGTPLMHTSWLVDGKQVSPADLRSAIVEKVQQRYSSEVKVSQERLSERDSVLEERDYVRIERAPANIFIYVTSFGSDLYISRTTTVQPALSPVRIAVLGVLFLLMLIGFIASAGILALFSALLLVFFVAIAIHSVVLGLTEKDFLVYLRPNILNDFRIDDGAILEHIADRGVQSAAEELQLDSSILSAATRNYPARQRLRFI